MRAGWGGGDGGGGGGGGGGSENRILAHEPEQPTAGCIAVCHIYCCYITHGGIITNLTL